MTNHTSKENKTEIIKETAPKEVISNDSTRHNDRIKPLCDRAPDPGAPRNVRVPKGRRLIKGIFKNMDCPGSVHSFAFRKYKEPIKTYNLMDGGEYTIPIEVGDHLNQNCAYKMHKWKLDHKDAIANEMGKGSNKEVASMKSRFAFIVSEHLTA